MCQAGTVWANLISGKTGQIVGHADVNVIFWASLSNKTLTWQVGGKAVVKDATGEALAATITGNAMCSGGCTVAPSPSAPLPLRVGEFMRGSWDITSLAPTAAPVTSGQFLQFTIASPLAIPGLALTSDIGVVRCDNGATLGPVGPGCVYSDVAPVFVLSGSAPPASPQHAAFVQSALAAGKPGSPTGTPLTRLADDAQKKANRTLACKNFVANPSPPNTPPALKDSCDEFPYAGTYEGGANTVTAHVPAGDNSNGGTKYSAFIMNYRVRDKDKFFITVLP
jgi:hypothetical protein